MSTDTSHQRRVFEFLKTFLPPGQSLADALCNLLYVSSDSAYRRIRGETPLTLDELKIICIHFRLSADRLLELTHPNRMVFESTQITDNSISLHEYLKKVFHQLEYIAATKQSKIIYCSKDLPLFHFFFIPELMAFKFNFWMQVVGEEGTYKKNKFSLEVQEEVKETCQKALKIYANIHSTEIWNFEAMNTTLHQLDYLWQTGVITERNDMLRVFDLLDVLLEHLEMQAEKGTKFLPGQNPSNRRENYEMFVNEISLADTILLAETGIQNISLINYGVLNYITTEDPRFASTLTNDLNNLIKRSTQLSQANEKQRAKFFNVMHRQIDEQRNKI